MISAAAQKTQCLLLGGVCLAACSRGWVQHCRMTLCLSAFCLCSHRTQRGIASTGKRNRENEVDGEGEKVPVDIRK